MKGPMKCPECGAVLPEGVTCRDLFNKVLAWEFSDFAGAGTVHHLTVLCFNLQHPRLLSPEGLDDSRALLEDFLERGMTPAEAMRKNRAKHASSPHSLKASPRASWGKAIRWPVTLADIAGDDPEGWPRRVKTWARSIGTTLRREIPRPLR